MVITVRCSLAAWRRFVPFVRHGTALILDILQVSSYDVGVFMCSDRTIQRLNRESRGLDKPTDILSFPFYDAKQVKKPGVLPEVADAEWRNLGDMVISMPYVQRACAENGWTLGQRLPELLTHGVLHLMHYDHETDEQFREMQKMEQHVLDEFTRRLPDWQKKYSRFRLPPDAIA